MGAIIVFCIILAPLIWLILSGPSALGWLIIIVFVFVFFAKLSDGKRYTSPFRHWLRKRKIKKEQEQFINNLVGGLEKEINSQNLTTNAEPSNVLYASPKSLLTSAQIEQLNTMRSQINPEEVKQFPVIRVSGNDMPNLVAGAGMFTAKIKRHGAIENLVVMLSTISAINDFERMCITYGESPKDFWAEGHLLPSRTGISYSVLFVTAFRLCGKRIIF
jgi:energy-coupling factor transporter transmembrane protein EcfT